MKCVLCKCLLIEKSGNYEFESLIVGKVSIPNINYFECPNCKEKLLTTHEHKKIINYVSAKESEVIAKQPFGKFIAIKTAASLLGMTKQAFSKNSRIKRGFILSAEIDRRKYYLLESVKLFKSHNDGRFLIKEKPDRQTIMEKGTIAKEELIYSICDFSTNYSGSFQKHCNEAFLRNVSSIPKERFVKQEIVERDHFYAKEE